MRHDISRGVADIDRASAPEPFIAFRAEGDALPRLRAYQLRLRLAPGQVAQFTSFAGIPLKTGDFPWVSP